MKKTGTALPWMGSTAVALPSRCRRAAVRALKDVPRVSVKDARKIPPAFSYAEREDRFPLLFTPSQAPLTYDRDARELLSPVGVAFAVTAAGIPNMIPASAKMVSQPRDEET